MRPPTVWSLDSAYVHAFLRSFHYVPLCTLPTYIHNLNGLSTLTSSHTSTANLRPSVRQYLSTCRLSRYVVLSSLPARSHGIVGVEAVFFWTAMPGNIVSITPADIASWPTPVSLVECRSFANKK